MRSLSLALLVLLAACSKSKELPPPDSPLPWGGACADGCDPLTCLEDPRFPGGYCTRPCDEPCGEGAACVGDFGVDLCFGTCGTDAECRSAHMCWRGTCRPPCAADRECGDGGRCEAGRCAGAECVTSADCAMGSCIGGRCLTPDAGTDAMVGDCDPSTCDGVCLPASLGGGCAARCSDTSECAGATVCSRARYDDDGDGTTDRFEIACLPANADGRLRASPCTVAAELDDCESRSCHATQCVEACDDDGDCLLGQTCRGVSTDGLTTSICWYDDATGSFDEIDLGVFDLRAGSTSARVNFAIPEDARSIAFIGEQVGGAALPMAFVNVWDPLNRRLFDLAAISMLEDQPIRWLPFDTEDVMSMLIPNSTRDRINFRQGRWGVSVGALGATPGDDRMVTIRLRALIKRDRIDRGTLDVNVHIASGLGFNAASAPSNSRLQDALDAMSATYAQASITIGARRYFNVADSRLSIIDTTDGPGSELAQLFESSRARSEHAVNIFLVRSIDGGGAGVTLGIAGGIPGPFAQHGTSHSGVVVSFDTAVVGGGSTVAAQIMSHEVGHYLGLFHNRENARPCGAGEVPPGCSPFGGEDPIADTTATNRNLMYWALQTFGGGRVNNQITDGQGFVLIRNPLVVR